jgi:hypothetical protein
MEKAGACLMRFSEQDWSFFFSGLSAIASTR